MIKRVRNAVRRRIGMPLIAPIHRRGLVRWRDKTFPLVDALASEAKLNGREPVILTGIHHRAGDVLMATAVVRALRQRNPQATLVFATRAAYRSLLEHDPHLDHIIECDCVGSLLALAGHEAFDRVELLNIEGDGCELCGAVYHDSYGPFCALGMNYLNWFKQGRHLVDLWLERAGCADADPRPEIHVPIAIELRMRDRLRQTMGDGRKPVVAMHTRAPHWPAKEWPHDRFHRLMERLAAELEARIVVIGSEPAAAVPPGVFNLTRQTTLLEAAAILKASDLFIGLDSGPAHLAAAVGTPSILLFGPTDPGTCRPRGRNVTALWHGADLDGLFAVAPKPGAAANRDMELIAVDEVVDAARGALLEALP